MSQGVIILCRIKQLVKVFLGNLNLFYAIINFLGSGYFGLFNGRLFNNGLIRNMLLCELVFVCITGFVLDFITAFRLNFFFDFFLGFSLFLCLILGLGLVVFKSALIVFFLNLGFILELIFNNR